MKLFLTLCFVALSAAAPALQDEDVAPEALPYVHEEPVAAPVAAVAPVAYAGYPFTYTLPVATSVAAKAVPASTTYAIAAPTYYIAAVKTGCINNVGSVVPCA